MNLLSLLVGWIFQSISKLNSSICLNLHPTTNYGQNVQIIRQDSFNFMSRNLRGFAHSTGDAYYYSSESGPTEVQTTENNNTRTDLVAPVGCGDAITDDEPDNESYYESDTGRHMTIEPKKHKYTKDMLSMKSV